MLRSIWRGALGAVVWGAMALGAAAQTNVPQKPANYQSPSGAYIPAAPTNVVGVDSVTGNACLIGLTATCGLGVVVNGPLNSNGFVQAGLYDFSTGAGACLLTGTLGVPDACYHSVQGGGITSTPNVVYLSTTPNATNEIPGASLQSGSAVDSLTRNLANTGFISAHVQGATAGYWFVLLNMTAPPSSGATLTNWNGSTGQLIMCQKVDANGNASLPPNGIYTIGLNMPTAATVALSSGTACNNFVSTSIVLTNETMDLESR